ncbi:hypothetical protein [Acinetobacter baumannii]|uniref:hypothetical protein n=1 Tax=Acinetobacter baumannii TaxID=470 RepID=UPI001C044EB4|nr:hypothetical protein [Acinetobacter baumannii]MBU0399527.1 hypothetical protein [Acinetobacter baumannii]
MDEDEISIIAYNYVGYIKLKKDIVFPADNIKMMLFITKVESIGEFFLDMLAFPKLKRTLYFI